MKQDPLINEHDPTNAPFTLVRDHWGQLVLRDGAGKTHENVRVIPLFPLTDPEHWISICDKAGREIVCVEDPHQLPADARDVLEDELAHREFVPIVKRIVRVSSNVEPTEWHVETDRGPTQFILEREEDIRRLDKNRVAIVDSNGIRYLFADVAALDTKSRRIIEWYV